MEFKILWACGHEQFELVKQDLLGLLESDGRKGKITLTEKFHKQGIINELKNTSYNILITQEYLEPRAFEADLLEAIMENYPNMRIILVISDEHEGDEYAHKLVSVGFGGMEGDVLYNRDFTAANLYNILETPRKRAETKVYLHLNRTNSDHVTGKEPVSEIVITKILYHFNSLEATEDKLALLTHITKQYDQEQNYYILKHFPSELLDELKADPLVTTFLQKQEEIVTAKKTLSPKKEKSANYSNLQNQVEELKRQLEEAQNKTPQIVRKHVESFVDTPVAKPPSDYRKIITFDGLNKTGKTSLLYNAAYALSKKGRKVAIVESDIQNKGIFNSLKITSKTSVKNDSDKKSGIFRYNSLELAFYYMLQVRDLKEYALSSIFYDNIYLYCICDTPQLLKDFNIGVNININGKEYPVIYLYEALIHSLRTQFDCILIDTDPNNVLLNERLCTLSDDVIYVVDCDFLSLKQYQQNMLDKFERNIRVDNYKPVINKYLNVKRPKLDEIYTMLRGTDTSFMTIEHPEEIPIIPFDENFVVCTWEAQIYLDSEYVQESTKNELQSLTHYIYKDFEPQHSSNNRKSFTHIFESIADIFKFE